MKTTSCEALLPFARIPLLDQPTVIQRLDNLSRAIPEAERVNIYVKRDDAMPLGGGGNKLRKLEFLLGAAREEHADTIITIGGIQSNHARLTAAAAAKAGLNCEIMLGRQVPRHNEEYESGGNVLLEKLFGASVDIVAHGVDLTASAQARVEALRQQGRRPYFIPTGGSTPLGALGYVSCALEICRQEQDMAMQFDHIVVANGSSGTHAGLCAGMALAGRPLDTVQSFSTLAESATCHAVTASLVRQTLTLLGKSREVSDDMVRVDGSQRGDGYGIPTPAMKHALLALARTEGILLDPVYSGKAFAGMLSQVRSGRYQDGANLLFIMTGGTPALYGYRDALL
jgi:D-cysteine desulfhydrase